MILNAARQTVEQFKVGGGEVALCPDCASPLVPRLCEIKRSHFAHYPLGKGERRACVHEETEWHLAWKFAFLDLPGWEIEKVVEGVGAEFRADAYRSAGRRVREFVHSLSPHYVEKHRALLGSGYDVFWLLDGEEFRSARLAEFTCRNGTPGIRHLLKPRAMELVRELLPNVKVHFQGAVWQPGADDRYWFKVMKNSAVDELVRLFEKHLVKPAHLTNPAPCAYAEHDE